MEQLTKAKLHVFWHREVELIELQFNPADLAFKRGVQIAEIPIPGLDSPLLQFIRGQNETLTLALFFDSTDEGMGARATSVTERVDKIYQLTKIDPDTHAPPICRFTWGRPFPGNRLAEPVGNQRRNYFRCIVERVEHKYTLFTARGVPLRATLTVTLREYKPLDTQLRQLGLNSPDRTQVRVLRTGETLDTVAGSHYLRPGEWRVIADENRIEDPRRLKPGTFLTLPPLD